LDNKLHQYSVRARFEDPDRLPLHFQTQCYLFASIITTVQGPNELNWVLRLDEPIACHDVRNQQHIARTFLLKPNGLEAEAAMAHPPWEIVTKREIVTIALFLDSDSYPTKIVKPEDYRKYPLISDVRLLLEGGKLDLNSSVVSYTV